MTHKTSLSLSASAALFGSLLLGSAVADEGHMYKWKGKDGSHHYGDYVPPEYVDEEHVVINEHGVAVNTVRGKKTEEELAADRREAELAEERALRKQEEALRDRILLSTYLSVSEIEALRDRRLELLGAQLRVTQKYLEDLNEKLKRLERDAQRYAPYSTNPKAKPIDEKLARELSNTLNSILLYEKNLAKSLDEQAQVQQKFAADIKRFIELKGISQNQ